MLTMLFDFGVKILQFFSGLFNEVVVPRTWTWGTVFLYDGIPLLDTFENTYLFPLNIPGFPYGHYPDGLVPADMLSFNGNIFHINWTYTGNFLNLSLWIIGTAFLGIVVWNIVKKVVE